MIRTTLIAAAALGLAVPALAAGHSDKGAKMSEATLTVVYPATPGSKFDRDYYRDTHGAIVRQAWEPVGMTGMTVAYGVGKLGGGASPYHVVCMISFKDRAALDAAVGGPSAGPVFADIAKFTDVAPEAMIGE